MALLLGSGSTKPQYPYDMWYGVQGDFTSLDSKLKRVGNLDLHRILPIQSKMRRFVENPDGSVKYYLHQNDSRKKDSGSAAVLDCTDGNVMLEIPEHYFRMEIEGTKWIRAYSEYPLPGFVKIERKVIAPWYSTINNKTNTAASGCFLTWDGDSIARAPETGFPIFTANAADYRGGGNDSSLDSTYKSQFGMGRTAISKAGARAVCKDGTHIGAYRAYNEIAWLQRVEYANLNCQEAYNPALTEEGFHQGGLGSGTSVVGSEWSAHNGYYPFIPGGVTATLGNNTGVVDYQIKNWANAGQDKTVHVASYRGFEVPYEYLWMLADDVLIWHKEDRSTAYVCEDPKKFTSHSDNAETVPEGYVAITDLPRTNGYIKTCAMGGNGYCFPDTVGAGSTTGFCDYFYTPVPDGGKGWYGALFSAAAIPGAYAGFGCLHAYYRSTYTYAYSGFRLCRF